MTFLEAALDILRRERKPLHFKDITERAIDKKLLTFVGRTPEITMQTQLTAVVKKAPGNPFVRVKPGIFGLLRYPEAAAEPEPDRSEIDGGSRTPSDDPGRRRRRPGGGGRRPASASPETSNEEADVADTADAPEDPQEGSMSHEARAATLAETGVLESDGDGDGEDGAGEVAPGETAVSPQGHATADDGVQGRRRRRRRGGGGDRAESFGGGSPGGAAAAETGHAVEGAVSENGEAHADAKAGIASADGAVGDAASEPGGGPRRIMSPVDAAIEILRGQPPGRGVHVRQLADGAIRRRLIHGEANEAWRVMRAGLAAEGRHRLRAGQRPRVRAAGAGLYTLARRPPDAELERAEHVFGEARRALQERTLAALESRLADLPPGAFEAVARILLAREGFGPCTFVKRVEGTIYVEALRGRGYRPSRCLIGIRAGGNSAGRRAIGELRAGMRARGQDEGVLVLAGRLAEEAVAEWKQAGPPVEIADGAALAETCVRHGIGVVNAPVSVDFVDADFFAEMAEG